MITLLALDCSVGPASHSIIMGTAIIAVANRVNVTRKAMITVAVLVLDPVCLSNMKPPKVVWSNKHMEAFFCMLITKYSWTNAWLLPYQYFQILMLLTVLNPVQARLDDGEDHIAAPA